jgi:hypothetical protein
MAFGFGGLGATYPTRYGQPTSQAVDYLAPQDQWQKDWDQRYSSLAATSRAATPDQWVGINDYAGGPQAYLQALHDPSTQYRTTPSADGNGLSLSQIFVPGQAAVTPDFSGLNAEKDKMAPVYNNQAAQQQAYNGMLGNGQLNAIPGADYSVPGFGQITGNSNPYSVDVPSGVNLPQGSGTYGAGQQTGVYNPQQTSKQYWGL